MSTSNSVDDHIIHDQTVVSGFRHDSYAYFVGSATRVNWPLKVTDDLPEDPPRADVRLSRVCLRDRTQKRGPPLGSRMELTLSCQGLGEILYTFFSIDFFIFLLISQILQNTFR